MNPTECVLILVVPDGGPRADEVTRVWRRLRNEELYDLYSSPSIIRVIKSRRIRWVGHVARIRRGIVHTGIWWGNLVERGHFEDLRVDGRISLKWIFKKWDAEVWTGLIWLRIGTDGGRL
jgi:hypothetical protein